MHLGHLCTFHSMSREIRLTLQIRFIVVSNADEIKVGDQEAVCLRWRILRRFCDSTESGTSHRVPIFTLFSVTIIWKYFQFKMWYFSLYLLINKTVALCPPCWDWSWGSKNKKSAWRHSALFWKVDRVNFFSKALPRPKTSATGVLFSKVASTSQPLPVRLHVKRCTGSWQRKNGDINKRVHDSRFLFLEVPKSVRTPKKRTISCSLITLARQMHCHMIWRS